MEGPRFAALARPALPQTRASYLLSRRAMLRGAAGLTGGLAASTLLPRWTSSLTSLTSRAAAAPAASPQIQPVSLGNPAGKILLPGEAGLHDFGLDFTVTGPPAVFIAAGDTPGWSQELYNSVGGFSFGYAATLATPDRVKYGTGRAVQVTVHHGFSSNNDADIAWQSLAAALAGRGEVREARVKSVDLVEIVAVDGPHTILATVNADRFNALVVALRTGKDLVTVAIADFAGKKPTQDEAVKLAEKEAEKVRQPRPDRTDLQSAYNGTWTPGFGFGTSGSSIAGAPFFTWPTVLGNTPVPFSDETAETSAQRRQTTGGVQYQSHVEGPFLGAASPFSSHGLYYSGQSSFFGSSGAASNHHDELSVRLKLGLPGVKLTKIQVSSKERRYTYRVTSNYGTLCGIVLNRIVRDSDFPLGFTLHVLAVPGSGDTPAIGSKDLRDRLDPVVLEMADALESVLLAPDRAPLAIGVAAPF